MTWSGWEQSTSSVAEPSAISVKVTVPPGSTWAWSAVAATGAAEADGSAREGAGRQLGGGGATATAPPQAVRRRASAARRGPIISENSALEPSGSASPPGPVPGSGRSRDAPQYHWLPPPPQRGRRLRGGRHIMPTPAPDRIRTVAVVGHSHDGKTTLCEALLHTAGAPPPPGSTDQGTSIFDFEAEEQRRSISISSAVAHCDWKDTQVTLVDAPGFQDFAGEVACALAGADAAGLGVGANGSGPGRARPAPDAAVLVVRAKGSVPVGAEVAWEMIPPAGLPCLIVVNRMDRENAAYEATVDAPREAFGRKPIAVTIPIGSAEGFRGYRS